MISKKNSTRGHSLKNLGSSQKTLCPLVPQVGYGPVFRMYTPLHFAPLKSAIQVLLALPRVLTIKSNKR